MAWLVVKNRYQKDMYSDTRKTTILEYGFKLTVLVNFGHLFDTSEEAVCNFAYSKRLRDFLSWNVGSLCLK